MQLFRMIKFNKFGLFAVDFMLNKDGDGQAGEDVASSMSGRWVIPRTVPKRGAILNWAIPPANRV